MNRNLANWLIRLLPVLGLLFISGCASITPTTRGEPEFAPANPVAVQPPATYGGSIYMAGYSQPLFEDITARQVGDLLTVILDEETDASKEASTGITKDTSTDISSATLLGREVTMDGDPIFRADLNSQNDFTGESDSSQSNSLEGSITVTVSAVLPNGNLVVQGEKWIAINQGDEYVRLRGIVRQVAAKR